MSKYALNIDIEEIKLAMMNQDTETYLDLRNGQTISQDTEDLYWGLGDAGLTTDELEEVIHKEGWDFLLFIPSKSSHEQYRVMEEFIETITEKRFQKKLKKAIHGRGAFQRFKDILLEQPMIREQWFKYQDQWLEGEVMLWLEKEGLSITK